MLSHQTVATERLMWCKGTKQDIHIVLEQSYEAMDVSVTCRVCVTIVKYNHVLTHCQLILHHTYNYLCCLHVVTIIIIIIITTTIIIILIFVRRTVSTIKGAVTRWQHCTGNFWTDRVCKQESPADARVTRDSLRATAPSFQDGRQPPSWILLIRK